MSRMKKRIRESERRLCWASVYLSVCYLLPAIAEVIFKPIRLDVIILISVRILPGLKSEVVRKLWNFTRTSGHLLGYSKHLVCHEFLKFLSKNEKVVKFQLIFSSTYVMWCFSNAQFRQLFFLLRQLKIKKFASDSCCFSYSFLKLEALIFLSNLNILVCLQLILILFVYLFAAFTGKL